MTNLSDLLPAGAASKQLSFTASGTIANGQTVALQSDGTVTAIAASGGDPSVGSSAVFESAGVNFIASAFDSNSNKVVIAYQDDGNSSYGTAVVGTVSGTSITFGSPVIFESANSRDFGVCFDSSNNKIVISYMDVGNNFYGTAIVGTVSGTSISFGSAVVFNSGMITFGCQCVFDSNSNKVVIAYQDDDDGDQGTAIVGTVSGTSISFGSETHFETGQLFADYPLSITFDSNSNKVVIAYFLTSGGKAVVGTVSGTSISFGSAVSFNSGSYTSSNAQQAITFDSNSNKVVIAFRDQGNSYNGTAVVGTVSGTSISFGSDVVFNTGASKNFSAAFDSSVNKVIIAYEDDDNNDYGEVVVGTVSGTSISFTSPINFNAADTGYTSTVFDNNANKIVISYKNSGNSGYGTGVVFTTSGSNVSSFLGIADAAISNAASGKITMKGGVVTNSQLLPLAYTGTLGSEAAFESADTYYIQPIFDSSNNRIVIIYTDGGDSNHGKAIVGTVNASGNSISYGTPVTFNAATTYFQSGAFDSNSNKVVIVYRDAGDGQDTKSIVGTVSGTSISFGSEATISTNAMSESSTVFDTNSNKVVTFYRDVENSDYGTAAVGTVSGTSITFGTPVVFESANVGFYQTSSCFDTSNNKTVTAYRDIGNSGHGTAIVGTVSGTSISFGTAVVFNAATTEDVVCAFDSGNNKVVVAYRDNAAPKQVASRVGTVSGTSISFGTEATVQSVSASIGNPAIAYSPDAQRVVLVFKDGDNSNYGTYAIGAVSSTDITYQTPVVFAAAATERIGIAYDTNEDRFVIGFADGGNSNYGTSIVLNVAGAYPNLVPNTTYYVQNDGTLSTTSSTVTAGKAMSTNSINLDYST